MMTFCLLNEAMERDKSRSSPLMDTGEETRGMSVIRSGKDIRDENEGSFWDDFISLCNDSEGLADLLGVRRENVTSWPARIREALEKVDKHDMQGENKPDEPEEMIPTGQNGAVTAQKLGIGSPWGGT